MNITHHKNGEIKTLVEEAPYHPGYEDAGFKPKIVNNEPVAWYSEYNSSLSFKNHGGDWIPLYTHPVKEHFEDEPQAEELHEIMQSNAELTDEEIIKVYQSLWKFLPAEEPRLAKDIKEFARAILRKASEK